MLLKSFKTSFVLTGLLLLFSYVSYAQDKELFQTDVDTELKPWTDLEFYNDPNNFQFAIVSDNTGGMRPGIFEVGVEKLNLMMPEFVLSVGDLIQGYTTDTVQIKKEWDDFYTKIDKLNVPFFYLPGNHDITNLVMQKEWEKRFGKRYYSFTYRDVLYINLDSNDDDDHSITEDQTAFVIDALNKNSDARWTFILMHHPIWKYDTGGRFERIEKELTGRNHTVLAGHEHRYQYIKRNNTNYYVLGTTGGGSRLRGNRFGEFDHFVWVTMTDDGPIMANLRLDGILAHDIANDQTAQMARSMLNNTDFKFLLLTNEGDTFSHGTAYLRFTNTSDVPLNLDLSFHHHHQIDMTPTRPSVKINPGEEKILEISLESREPIPYEELGFLKYYWKLSYEGAEYEDFFLDGNVDFPIVRSIPDYFLPGTEQFINTTEVSFDQPFKNLKTEVYRMTNGKRELVDNKVMLDETATLELQLINDKDQSTGKSVKHYEQTAYTKGVKVRKAIPGLNYQYYEGKWDSIPDFQGLDPEKSGIATDFGVGDIAAGDKDNFGISYKGYIEVSADGLYHFSCRADDMASLKIHGKTIAFEGGDTGTEPQQTIALKKGFHPVTIDFVEQTGNERLRLYYRLKEEDDWIFMDLKDFFRTTTSKN